MLETMMPLVKRLGWVTLIGMVGVYIYISMTGPRGVSALLEKRRQITAMQEEKAELEKDNQRRREKVRRLTESPEEQEMEIRKRLKLEKPGTRDFYLPDSSGNAPEPPSSQ